MAPLTLGQAFSLFCKIYMSTVSSFRNYSSSLDLLGQWFCSIQSTLDSLKPRNKKHLSDMHSQKQSCQMGSSNARLEQRLSQMLDCHNLIMSSILPNSYSCTFKRQSQKGEQMDYYLEDWRALDDVCCLDLKNSNCRLCHKGEHLRKKYSNSTHSLVTVKGLRKKRQSCK